MAENIRIPKLKREPIKFNERTKNVVEAKRKGFADRARQLDGAMQALLGEGGVSAAFSDAKLSSTDAGSRFSLDNIASKNFTGKFGITEDDLTLSQEAVGALPNGDKKQALALRLAMVEFSKEVSDNQARSLWRQHILAGQLLDESAETGIGSNALSLEDLERLEGLTKDYSVLDEAHFPDDVKCIYKDGKPFFKVSSKTSEENIENIVNTLAAAGSKKIEVDCLRASELPQYKMMAKTAFKTIMENGHSMALQVNEPFFVSNPGQKNSSGVPLDVRKRERFIEGRNTHNFWQDVSRNMPNASGDFSDKGARYAKTYSGLQKKHKLAFTKMLYLDPETRPQLREMTSYFIRTGQLDQVLAMQKDLRKALSASPAPWENRTLESAASIFHDGVAAGRGITDDFSKILQEEMTKNVTENMTAPEMNVALDNGFKHTKASFHNPDLDFSASPLSHSVMMGNMISNMSDDQMSDYAKHLVVEGGAQKSVRSGMLLTHAKPEQREAFLKTYLGETQEQAIEKHGVNEEGIPLPEMKARYELVTADVNAAAQNLLFGAREYAARTEMPNREPLEGTLALEKVVLERLAHKSVDEMAAKHPGISPAERTRFVDTSVNTNFAETGAAQRLTEDRAKFADQFVPEPHVHGGPGMAPAA